jgi:ABC-type multidrug transport system ATPase subunit
MKTDRDDMELNENNIKKLIGHKCYFNEFISKLEKIILAKNDRFLTNEFINLKKIRNVEQIYNFCKKLSLEKIEIDLEKYNIVKFKNINLNLKDKFKLNNISFNIVKGEKVLIFGKNGSGKSSLLKLISGKSPIYYDEKSIMKIDNQDCLIEKNWLELNEKVLFLSNLDTRWKSRVGENIQFATLNNKKKIDKYKNFLEYNKYKNFKWHELSSGFKSRFLLVYGLIKKPKLLLLDEPFSTLDSGSFERYLDEIRKMEDDMTIVFSSQTLSNLEDIVDKVILIHNNSIQCFSRQELLKQDGFCYEIHFDEEVSAKDKSKIFSNIIEENQKKIIGESRLSKDEILYYLANNKIDISFFKDLQFSFELEISKYKRKKV